MRKLIHDSGKPPEFIEVEEDYHIGSALPSGIESNTNIYKLEDDTICIDTTVIDLGGILWSSKSRFTKDTFLRFRELLNEIKFDKEVK